MKLFGRDPQSPIPGPVSHLRHCRLWIKPISLAGVDIQVLYTYCTSRYPMAKTKIAAVGYFISHYAYTIYNFYSLATHSVGFSIFPLKTSSVTSVWYGETYLSSTVSNCSTLLCICFPNLYFGYRVYI
ncbi:hypothetical protein F4678DRAFT_150304 [Xylaria arbuscula]|nr:hypothetical protein F4678DRAFT_150304 [Xylaria arbuscula]